MALPEMEEFILLKRRAEELINDFKILKEENIKVRSENIELRNELKKKEEDLFKLNTDYERVKLSGAMLSEGEDNKEARKRINTLVREIDNCIALLNI